MPLSVFAETAALRRQHAHQPLTRNYLWVALRSIGALLFMFRG